MNTSCDIKGILHFNYRVDCKLSNYLHFPLKEREAFCTQRWLTLAGWGGDGSYWGCLGNLQLMDWGKSSKLHQMRYVRTWPTSCHEHSAGVASAHRSRVPRRWMPGCWSGVWDVVICRDLWAHGFSVHVAQAWLHCEFVTVSLLGFDSSFSVNLCT